MIKSIVNKLQLDASNDSFTSKREHQRRQTDPCIIEINGKPMPVLDWSMGGVQVMTEDRLFGQGDQVDFTLKFKIDKTILDVEHKGYVVRKAEGRIALEFEPLDSSLRNRFTEIYDRCFDENRSGL